MRDAVAVFVKDVEATETERIEPFIESEINGDGEQVIKVINEDMIVRPQEMMRTVNLNYVYLTIC